MPPRTLPKIASYMPPEPTHPHCLIRPSRVEDVAVMAAIYADAALTGTGSFETEAPEQSELARRRDELLGKGWPWLVALSGSDVVGMPAVIGANANQGSDALHRSLRFEAVGQFNMVGRKFDGWLDILLLQRTLGPGATLPEA